MVWLFYCTAVAALCGCEKSSGPTQVSGHVVEYSTGQPVPYAEVQLLVSHAQSGGFNIISGSSGPDAVGAPHVADANGAFVFSFDAKEAHHYFLCASGAPNYLNALGRETNIEGGRANKDQRVPVYARAWVRVQLVDEPPKSDVYISVQGFENDGISLHHPRDTVFVRWTLAGFKPSIAWFINEQGKERQSYVQIQPTPLDTVTVRIPF